VKDRRDYTSSLYQLR